MLLVTAPALSLTWSAGAGADGARDLLLAAYCVLWCYFGVAQVLTQRPSFADALAGGMLLAGNLAAAAALLAHGAAGADTPARLPGLWGIDNPVHASVLLLGSTLPMLAHVLSSRWPRWWLIALLLPLAFVVLAGARTAAAAYVIVVLALVCSKRPRAAVWVAAVACALAVFGVAIVGIEGVSEIWLSRGLSFRDVVWRQVWVAFQECPALVGCGIATPLTVEFGGVEGGRAHSIFMAALYHQGFLGLLLFLGALVWLLVRRAGTAARGWAWMLGFVLLANATSGDHVLVRASLFWACFWIPVMVLAASSATLRGSSTPAPP